MGDTEHENPQIWDLEQISWLVLITFSVLQASNE